MNTHNLTTLYTAKILEMNILKDMIVKLFQPLLQYFQIIMTMKGNFIYKLTFGMLTRDQKSSRCSLIFAGLYFEYRIANSVNIPMCALSKPNAASSKLINSSK